MSRPSSKTKKSWFKNEFSSKYSRKPSLVNFVYIHIESLILYRLNVRLRLLTITCKTRSYLHLHHYVFRAPHFELLSSTRFLSDR